MIRRLQPVGRYVALLSLGTVLPTVVCSAVLLQQLIVGQRSQVPARAQSSADRLAVLLDGKFESLTAVAQALSTSPLLAQDDIRAFYQQAANAVKGQKFALVLRTRDGHELINTRLPWGAPLPVGTLQDEIDKGGRTARPSVSNVYYGPVMKRDAVSISVPVLRNDAVKYVLSVTIRPDQLLNSILPPDPARTWWVGIVDRRGKVGAETGPHPADHGPSAATTLPASGWRVVLRGPVQSALSIATKQTRDQLILFGLVSTILGVFAAWLLGRAISRPLHAIGSSAKALARDEPRARSRTQLLEISELENSLDEVATLLRGRAAERDLAIANLQDLNRTLEARVAEETAELSQAYAKLEHEVQERAEVETQLRKMQKLEAVGLLTGGIAHDFNNMLSIVIGSIELAERRLAGGKGPIDSLLRDAHSGAASAAELTSQLLAFARQQSLSPRQIDLNDLVFGMRDMLQRTLGERITVDLRLSADLWTTFVDRAQMESALVNLAINARDAMPDGGSLTIETGNRTVDEGSDLVREQVEIGDYAVVTVSDSGTGIAPEIIDRIIDPFFTTKEVGKGSGLGLSQVHGFIRQSRGFVKIHSKLGHGTSVRLYLPKHSKTHLSIVRDDIGIDSSDKGKTVLVVEDNDNVRAMSVESIRSLGYRVVHSSSGEDALQKLRDIPDVDILFTDVVMPGMNGKNLADAATQFRPDLKVIFATGYSRNVITQNGIADKGSPVILKPFTLKQLENSLREVLVGEAA